MLVNEVLLDDEPRHDKRETVKIKERQVIKIITTVLVIYETYYKVVLITQIKGQKDKTSCSTDRLNIKVSCVRIEGELKIIHNKEENEKDLIRGTVTLDV